MIGDFVWSGLKKKDYRFGLVVFFFFFFFPAVDWWWWWWVWLWQWLMIEVVVVAAIDVFWVMRYIILL